MINRDVLESLVIYVEVVEARMTASQTAKAAALVGNARRTTGTKP